MTMAPGDYLAQLSLEELRAHRRVLLTESANTSRWRRLVQARLDLAVAATAPADPLERPCPVIPEPPATDELREVVESVPDDPIDLMLRLHRVRRSLDGYGESVEAAAALATRELVERYTARPVGCLAAVRDAG
jgi:hypothetical protein